MNKQTARRKGLQARKNLSHKERKIKSDSIFHQLIPLLEKSEVIGCYVSIREEADTSEIISWCLCSGKVLCVPKVEGNTLQFYRVHGVHELVKGFHGILEPAGGEIIPVSDIDLMLVPVAAFDEKGNRCGYGKGYYDSILARCRAKIGLAFAEQKTEGIETEEHDVPLDAMITA